MDTGQRADIQTRVGRASQNQIKTVGQVIRPLHQRAPGRRLLLPLAPDIALLHRAVQAITWVTIPPTEIARDLSVHMMFTDLSLILLTGHISLAVGIIGVLPLPHPLIDLMQAGRASPPFWV